MDIVLMFCGMVTAAAIFAVLVGPHHFDDD